jgi:hypothetical protein
MSTSKTVQVSKHSISRYEYEPRAYHDIVGMMTYTCQVNSRVLEDNALLC